MKKVLELLAAAGGAVIGFFATMPPLVWILIAVMTLDYITGLICGFMGVSPKTETGGLSSGAAFKGLMKKILILLVVLLAALVDRAVTYGSGMQIVVVTGATCFWFVASEGLSVLENATAMGVPIPHILLHALEIIRKQGDQSAEKQEEQK